LRQFRESKVNQGRQSLALHLATDITDRLELGFESFPPATLSISVSRCAVGCKDPSPVSTDPCFVSQFIRIKAQRPFGVLIARLHGPAQLAPPEQIAQFPLQIVTHVKPWFIGAILLLMRSDQSDSSQLADLSSLCRCPLPFYRLALTITKADGLKRPIRQQPERIIAELIALVRPGGMIASYEADYLPHTCDPPSPAWNRLFEVFEAYSRAHGIDLFVGRRTHRMPRDAGIVDIQVKPVIHVYPHGHNRRMVFWDFIQNVRDRIVAQGLLGAGQLTDLMAELKTHLDDPGTLVVSHLFFQVWGRKPAR
jgi:hypothetical protein